jgi:hypothetical protein
MHPDVPSDHSRDGAGGPRRELARSVADDLEGIFQAAPAPAAPSIKARSIRPTGGAGASSPARIGGVVAAALAGLALGVLLVDGVGQTKPEEQPVARVNFAAAEVTRPVATPPVAAPVEAIPPPVRVERTAPPRAESPARVASRDAKPKLQASRKRAEPSSGRCEQLTGGARARCSYPAVLAADRRLRRAYADATRAGVSNGRLESYRNRWASLRHRADDQPARVIRAYGDMARDLNRLAASARS